MFYCLSTDFSLNLTHYIKIPETLKIHFSNNYHHLLKIDHIPFNIIEIYHYIMNKDILLFSGLFNLQKIRRGEPLENCSFFLKIIRI